MRVYRIMFSILDLLVPLVILSWTGYQEIQYPETNVVHPIGILSSKYPSYSQSLTISIYKDRRINPGKCRVLSKIIFALPRDLGIL